MNLIPRSIPGKTLYYRVNDAAARSPARVLATVRGTGVDACAFPLGAYAALAPMLAPEGVEPWVYVTLDESRPAVIRANAARAATLGLNVILNPEGGHDASTMRGAVLPAVLDLLAKGCTVVVSTNSGQIAGLVDALRDTLDNRRLFLRLQAYDHNREADFTWAASQLARIEGLARGAGAMGLDIGALEGPTEQRFAAYFAALPRGVSGGFGIWYDSLSPKDMAAVKSWHPSASAGFAVVSALVLIVAIAFVFLTFGGV